jgi:xanthine dehydrogenase iron-sulfur cluster and FAD-binding subunit A
LTIRAKKTEQFLQGKPMNRDTMKQALEALKNDVGIAGMRI